MFLVIYTNSFYFWYQIEIKFHEKKAYCFFHLNDLEKIKLKSSSFHRQGLSTSFFQNLIFALP